MMRYIEKFRTLCILLWPKYIVIDNLVIDDRLKISNI